jgi:hypothetical protein
VVSALKKTSKVNTILKIDHLKDHPCHVCFKLAYWFQRRRFLNIFPIGSYVKTMSTDGKFKMATMTRLNFNIGPYGKKCLKVFSSETSKSV